MTVPAKTPVIEYLEDGATLSFAFPYQFNDPSHLHVFRQLPGDAFVEIFGWSTAGAGNPAGGSVTLASTIAGATLQIVRRTTIEQPTRYPPLQPFPAASNEGALDRATLIMQDQAARQDDLDNRAIKVPLGEIQQDLPLAALRTGGNKILGPNAQTGAIEVLDGGAFQGSPGANVLSTGPFIALAGQAITAGTDLVQTSRYNVVPDGFARYVADAAVTAITAAANPLWQVYTGGRGFRLAEGQPSAAMLGAPTVGDAAPAISTALIAYAAPYRLPLRLTQSYSLASAIAMPVGGRLSGAGAYNQPAAADLKATVNSDGITLNSNCAVDDVWIDGGGGSGSGIKNAALIARPSVRRSRIENFTAGVGFSDVSSQNALVENIFAQNNMINFSLGGQNMLALGCSGNLGGIPGGAPAGARNWILNGTRIRLHGGIFERGALNDYQGEMQGGYGFTLDSLEMNSAVKASIKMTNGPAFPLLHAAIRSVHFSFNDAISRCIQSGNDDGSSPGGVYNVTDPTFTGLSGRLPILLFGGNPQWNGDAALPIQQSTFKTGLDGFLAVGGGSATLVTAAGGGIACAGSTVSSGVITNSYSNFSKTAQVDPTGRYVRLRFIIDQISVGNVSIYVICPATPFRRLIGTYAAGYYEVCHLVATDEVLNFEITAGEAVAKTWRLGWWQDHLL